MIDALWLERYRDWGGVWGREVKSGVAGVEAAVREKISQLTGPTALQV